MLAVYGTLLACGGVVFFFVMLHFHRRPGVAHWLETRAVGEITVFVSMMISLMGVALIGRFFIHYNEEHFGTTEGLELAIILVGTVVTIWKIYLPPPAEEAPSPLIGIVTGRAAGTATPTTRTPSGRKAA